MKKLLSALFIIILTTTTSALATDTSLMVSAALLESKTLPGAISLQGGGIMLDMAAEELICEAKYADDLVISEDNKNASVAAGADFVITAWSIDEKWSDKPLNAKALKKLFDKGGVLRVTDDYDKRARKPTIYANTYTFPKLTARPKANPYKGKVFYRMDNTWVLTRNGTPPNPDSIITTYEYVLASNDKKTPVDEASWTSFTQEDVSPSIDKFGLKVPKQTYLFRVAPVVNKDTNVYSAISKTWKVTPLQLTKAPKYKVDYKKEILRVNTMVFITAGETPEGSTPSSMSQHISEISQVNDTTLDVSRLLDYVTPDDNTIYLQTPALGKKPASERQALQLAPRAEAPSDGITVTAKGKLKAKNFEFITTKVWGKPNFKTVEKDNEYEVRLEAEKVKIAKDGTVKGYAASFPSKAVFTITTEMVSGVKTKVYNVTITPYKDIP